MAGEGMAAKEEIAAAMREARWAMLVVNQRAAEENDFAIEEASAATASRLSLALERLEEVVRAND